MGIIILCGGVGDGICGIGSPASQMFGIKVGLVGSSGFRCSGKQVKYGCIDFIWPYSIKQHDESCKIKYLLNFYWDWSFDWLLFHRHHSCDWRLNPNFVVRRNLLHFRIDDCVFCWVCRRRYKRRAICGQLDDCCTTTYCPCWSINRRFACRRYGNCCCCPSCK